MNGFPTPYWIIYYLAFLTALASLLSLYWDGLTTGAGNEPVYLLAAIFGAAGGAAITFTITTELGARAMLLIPAAVKKIKNQGREEGHAEGRQQGREERDERRREAYEKFGVEVDGVMMLPNTPEVEEFLRGEPGKD